MDGCKETYTYHLHASYSVIIFKNESIFYSPTKTYIFQKTSVCFHSSTIICNSKDWKVIIRFCIKSIESIINFFIFAAASATLKYANIVIT